MSSTTATGSRPTSKPSRSPKWAGYRIIVHPPAARTKRAFTPGDVIEPAKPYLDRNIVNRAHLLIATPKGHREELRSGTWAMVRYARQHGIPVLIIRPDGSVM